MLPFAQVPLTVFEPRYINMIEDALGQQRLIGIIQPKNQHSNLVPDDAPLFDVGTVGRIVTFQELDNGCFGITLEGMSRFRLAGAPHIDLDRGYRIAEVDFKTFIGDFAPTEHADGPGRLHIIELMQNYFTNKGIDADWEAVGEASYEALVSSLTMTSPFEPREKQALLECANHEERARMLISLFEINKDGTSEAGPSTH